MNEERTDEQVLNDTLTDDELDQVAGTGGSTSTIIVGN